MRWTTFTKLPEAFSGGRREKRDPVPLWIESTRARNTRSGCVSTETHARWPTRTWVSWVSL